MFQLDDKFLEDLGLAALPEDQKQEFLQYVYSQLELRVGTRLSEGMSNELLGQFESFMDRNMAVVQDWLESNVPNYQSDDAFVQLKQAAGETADDNVILSEFASLKWLEKNRPDYREVVKSVLEELKQEIISNKDSILGAS